MKKAPLRRLIPNGYKNTACAFAWRLGGIYDVFSSDVDVIPIGGRRSDVDRKKLLIAVNLYDAAFPAVFQLHTLILLDLLHFFFTSCGMAVVSQVFPSFDFQPIFTFMGRLFFPYSTTYCS